MEQPIAFGQWNITVMKEYAPGKLVFGMDEPGFLLADLGLGGAGNGDALGSVTLQAETARFQQSFGEESK